MAQTRSSSGLVLIMCNGKRRSVGFGGGGAAGGGGGGGAQVAGPVGDSQQWRSWPEIGRCRRWGCGRSAKDRWESAQQQHTVNQPEQPHIKLLCNRSLYGSHQKRYRTHAAVNHPICFRANLPGMQPSQTGMIQTSWRQQHRCSGRWSGKKLATRQIPHQAKSRARSSRTWMVSPALM